VRGGRLRLRDRRDRVALLLVSAARLHDPQTLYRHWEDAQWNPFAVDLTRDREQWPGLAQGDRELILFVLGSLMVAEERITTKFSGLVAAYGSEEEATFLATQQVDEARHMQFYARVQDEVIAEPATVARHVERARDQVSDSFRVIFDEQLVTAHERLVAAPRDKAAKVRFVTVYHQILEATLGLTTFEFSTRYLNREGLLPGFVKGYSYIHRDEQRHIGYGTWYLREAVRDDPAAAEVVRDTLRELLPAVAGSLATPEGTDPGALGVTTEELREFALKGLTRRMNIIGVPLESVWQPA
jgi:ribonucleoside-diphosphate reductase beta chain